MRASSLSYNTIAVNREIDSAYDAVLEVRDNLTNIATVAGLNIDTILADLQDAKDFTGITVVVGEVPSWDSNTKTITVPTLKGDTGATGSNGVDGIQGPVGETGPRGIQGIQGIKGDTGSVGIQGPEGPSGPKGETGEDLTVEQIVYNGNGTFTWNFSDETVYTTPNMVGPQGLQGSKGDKGDTGISVHHTKGTSTTDSEGDFNASGEKDTYTMYGDAAETLVLGWFTVQNGNDAYNYAQDGGYVGTREDFSESLSSITSIETSSQLSQWVALANEMTTDSFANEPVDVEVKIYSSNGDGTFTSVLQTGEYSALHYKIKAEESYEKALALGNGYVVANNTERNNLTLLTTADTVFVADDGDGKWARYQVVAVTNGNGSTSTFKVIMDEDTYLHANTAADIKAAYESNDNTNAFTDSEKLKLDDTEVTAQLDARDTYNRNTDSHTDGLINGVYTLAERTKLSTIEVNAKDDQTAEEIEILYEGLGNTNKYTDAEKLKLAGIIDDTTASTLTAYSGSKVQEMHNAQAATMAALGTAQGEIANTNTPVFASIPKYPLVGVLDFTTVVGSTNISMFEIDATNNLFAFKQAASYTFLSEVVIKSNVSAARVLTFNLVDNDTNAVLMTQSKNMIVASGNTENFSISTLLMVDVAPKNVRVEVSCSDTGYEFRSFNSILASSVGAGSESVDSIDTALGALVTEVLV